MQDMNIRRNIALAMLLAAGLGVQAQTEVTTFVPTSSHALLSG